MKRFRYLAIITAMTVLPLLLTSGKASAAQWGGVGNAYDPQFHSITSGQSIWSDWYMSSPNDMYVLILQNDGNLVLYGNGAEMWNSGTHGSGTNRLVMQNDGNLVLYNSNGTAVWNTHTYGRGPSHADLDNDGNFHVTVNDGPLTWNTGTGGHQGYLPFSGPAPDSLQTGKTLPVGFYMRTEHHALLFQPDGNLVLYGPGYHVLWNSGTYGSGATRLVMQNDGNLVLYRANGTAVWNTHTYGRGPSYALLQQDGNFVVYITSTGQWTWMAGTAGRI